MAATVTVDHSINMGEFVLEFGTITLDSSYPTGGEAIDVTGDAGYYDCSLSPSTGGYVGTFVASSQKVMALYGDNNNASDGPLIEVPATTDLSAVVFRFRGYRVK